MKKAVLIDSNAVIHRAFHALPPLNSPDGRLINAAYGFSQILLKVLNDLKPDYIACVFDFPKPTFRHKEYKEYKAKRIKKGEELYGQFPIIKEIIENFSIPIYEMEGYEADDIIATAVAKLKSQNEKLKNNIEAIIVTGDLDALQLVDEQTKVLTMRRGITDTVLYDESKVKERFGLEPKQLVDYKALTGDASDNILGVKKIGEKTACELIKNYKTLNGVYQSLDKHKEKVRQLLKDGKNDAFFSKKLIVLDKKVPIKMDIDDLEFKNFQMQKTVLLFSKLGFKSLIKRIPGYSEKDFGKKNLSLFEDQSSPKTKADKIDKDVEPILREMEKTGIKINKEHLKKISEKVNKEIIKLKQTIFHKCGGEFNLDSPRQLSQILFTRLSLEIKDIKKNKTGISTASAQLSKLRNAHPVIELILRYREIAKLKNTYLDTLVNMADEKSRLHTTYTQDTQTGRIASKNPNLQNIPVKTELGNEIRKAFVAEGGNSLISADYSQIELRVVAHHSIDSRMTMAFLKGEDIHEAVCRAMKVDRRTAKMINFGIIYGLSSHGLSEALRIPHHVAGEYINRYFKLHPKILEFIKKTISATKEKGYIETDLGRRRYLPEINSPDIKTQKAAERMAINMPNQGLAADILKLAMISINPKIKALGGRMILTVHDELVFEIPNSANIEKASKTIKETMENVYKLKVPLVIEIKLGKNWGEMREMVVK